MLGSPTGVGFGVPGLPGGFGPVQQSPPGNGRIGVGEISSGGVEFGAEL